jgi:hypothetical protein
MNRKTFEEGRDSEDLPAKMPISLDLSQVPHCSKKGKSLSTLDYYFEISYLLQIIILK